MTQEILIDIREVGCRGPVYKDDSTDRLKRPFRKAMNLTVQTNLSTGENIVHCPYLGSGGVCRALDTNKNHTGIRPNCHLKNR